MHLKIFKRYLHCKIQKRRMTMHFPTKKAMRLIKP